MFKLFLLPYILDVFLSHFVFANKIFSPPSRCLENNVAKHCLECFIYFLNQKQKQRRKWRNISIKIYATRNLDQNSNPVTVMVSFVQIINEFEKHISLTYSRHCVSTKCENINHLSLFFIF